MEITLDVDDGVALGGAATASVLRIAQEALPTRVRHAGADARAACRLARGDGPWCSRSPTTAPASTRPIPSCAARRLGLTSMEERAARLGGRLEIRSAPGAGTGYASGRWLRPIRVLIVDDHAVVREGLRTFLSLQEGIEVVGEAADGVEARRRGASGCGPTWC